MRAQDGHYFRFCQSIWWSLCVFSPVWNCFAFLDHPEMWHRYGSYRLQLSAFLYLAQMARTALAIHGSCNIGAFLFYSVFASDVYLCCHFYSLVFLSFEWVHSRHWFASLNFSFFTLKSHHIFLEWTAYFSLCSCIILDALQIMQCSYSSVYLRKTDTQLRAMFPEATHPRKRSHTTTTFW